MTLTKDQSGSSWVEQRSNSEVGSQDAIAAAWGEAMGVCTTQGEHEPNCGTGLTELGNGLLS